MQSRAILGGRLRNGELEHHGRLGVDDKLELVKDRQVDHRVMAGAGVMPRPLRAKRGAPFRPQCPQP